jgi:hypothetical protein
MLEVIVQCAIEDKQGRKFWAANFLSLYRVPWYVVLVSPTSLSCF